MLFLGVLYHVKDPLSCLEQVASVTGEMLVVETETALDIVALAGDGGQLATATPTPTGASWAPSQPYWGCSAIPDYRRRT